MPMTDTIDEAQLTGMLSLLLGDERLSEGDDLEKGTKRRMRLREVKHDILSKLMSGEELSPSDVIKLFGLFYLFMFEYSGSISFPYEDVFEWIAFKRQFYDVIESFDSVFEFKKGSGRPTQDQTKVIELFSILCREHNNPDCPHRDKCECNYVSLLTDAVELRLVNSEQWLERKTAYEREKIFRREFKAAKTAVDRIWKELYRQKPPKVYGTLQESVREFVLESLETS